MTAQAQAPASPRSHRWPANPARAPRLRLFPDQRRALKAARTELRRHASVMLTLATGGGKTEIAVALAAETGWKVLFLAPSRAVVTQTVSRFQHYGIPARAYMGRQWHPSRFRWPDDAQVVVTTYATAAARSLVPADLVIVDEAHHASNAPSQITSVVLRQKAAGSRILGLTATCWRLNRQQGFGEVWDHLEERESLPELVARRRLVPLRVEHHGSDRIETGSLNSAGDFSVADMERRNEANPIFTERLVEWWAERARRDDGTFGRSMAYAVSQRHALNIANLAAEVPGARVGLMLSGNDYIQGAHPSIQAGGRGVTDDAILQRLRDGDLDLVVSVGKALEGVDVPALDFVVNGRATTSLVVMLQSYGRAARAADGKEEGVVLDGTDNLDRLYHPMQRRRWSLSARAYDADGEPWVRRCTPQDSHSIRPWDEGCPQMLASAQQECPECHAPQGAECEGGCGKFNLWDRLDSSSVCERCRAGEAPPAPVEWVYEDGDVGDESPYDAFNSIAPCPECGTPLLPDGSCHWSVSDAPRSAECGCDCGCKRFYRRRADNAQAPQCCGCAAADGTACGCNGADGEALISFSPAEGAAHRWGWWREEVPECAK